MNIRFEKAMEELLEYEGGYVNDPLDAGGETIAGISRRWFPKWDGWAYIDNMENPSEAMKSKEVIQSIYSFYYTYFWIKLGGDMIDDARMSHVLFNFGVNVGKRTAVKKVQRILRLKTDGVLGPITVRAMNSTDKDKLIIHFLLEIIELYTAITENKSSNRNFIYGWVRRAINSYRRIEGSIR